MICTYILIFCLSAILFFVMKKRKQPHPFLSTLTDWDIKFMAYHEAGHAVCSYFLPEREELVLITIDPSSEAFGMVRTRNRAHHNETRISFSSMISTLLAGRLSEEMFLKTQTTSCIHDLASVQEIASDMVTKFGMGKTTGLAVLGKTDENISRFHEAQICADILQVIREAENDARKILQEHQVIVIALAEKLMKQNTLASDEISCFFEQHIQEGKDEKK